MANIQGYFGKRMKQACIFREMEDSLVHIRKHYLQPLLKDTGQIERMYRTFLNTMRGMHPKVRDFNNTVQRSKFIFLVLAFYSPQTLYYGKRMRRNVRDRVADVTGCAKTLISHNCRNVAFYYASYKEFREDVDLLYSSIKDDLGKDGLLHNVEHEFMAKGTKDLYQWAKIVNMQTNRILDLEK